MDPVQPAETTGGVVVITTTGQRDPAAVVGGAAHVSLLPAELQDGAGCADAARQAHDDLAAVTEQLIGEYQDLLPPGSVMRTVARQVVVAREQGTRSEELAAVVAARVRAQLHDRIHHGGILDLRTPAAVAAATARCSCDHPTTGGAS